MQRVNQETRGRERGAAGVLVAIMMVVLIGAGALAVDTGQIYAERAQLQNGADAGALAGADLCSVAGGCTQANAKAVADALADGNANDAKSTVQSVDLSVAGQVTVTTSTKDGTTSAGFLTKMFANALNAPPVTVGATATAKWLYPTKGVSVLPLTFATCEFKDDGLPHKILTQGGTGGAQDCNGLNPSNQVIPGGFAWLAPDSNVGCKVTAEIGQWSITSAGAGVPTGCVDLFNPSVNPSLHNSTVALPVYKYTCKGMPGFGSCTGSNVEYYIEKWAGFKLQAWSLTGQAKYNESVFSSSEKGLYGTFVGYSADPGLFTGGTTTPTGNVVVLGLIK